MQGVATEEAPHSAARRRIFDLNKPVLVRETDGRAVWAGQWPYWGDGD